MRKLGVMYSLIHQRLKEKQYPDSFIWRKDLFVILGRIYHVPKAYRHNIMDELIELGCMRWNKHDYLEIL